MFDVGFSEILLIGVVALIVLGPERLPGAARTVGALLRRARASWSNVRAEVERELAAEELKRNMRETAAAVDPGPALRAAAEDLKSTRDDVAKSFDERA
ncbi:MAG: Sec-independent protein translocase protein TatB [Tahibacter sp.]